VQPVHETPAPAPAPTPTYKFDVNVQGSWAYVTVDGDPAQHQTPTTLELTAGQHHLHLSNPELHADKDITIDVPAHDGAKWVGALQD
jgi:hypothetical protein